MAKKTQKKASRAKAKKNVKRHAKKQSAAKEVIAKSPAPTSCDTCTSCAQVQPVVTPMETAPTVVSQTPVAESVVTAAPVALQSAPITSTLQQPLQTQSKVHPIIPKIAGPVLFIISLLLLWKVSLWALIITVVSIFIIYKAYVDQPDTSPNKIVQQK